MEKKLLLTGVKEVFSDKWGKKMKDEDSSSPLFEEIGRLKVELDWLKKKIGKFT